MNWSLRNGIHSTTTIFLLFFVCVYAKIVCFHAFVFGVDDFSQIIYFSKLVPALFFAAFIYVTKLRWWTITLAVLVDVWAISNLIYFKANGVMLNVETILLADNMDGFWSSVWNYVDWQSFVFLGITVVYALCVWFLKDGKKRNWKAFAICLFFVALFHFFDLEFRREVAAFHSKHKQKEIYDKYGKYSIFFRDAKYKAEGNHWRGMEDYIEKNTIIHYFPAQFVYHIYQKNFRNQNIEFSSKDSALVVNRICIPSVKPKANENLFIILIESLESWPLNLTDCNGVEITPTLNSFAKQASLVALRCKSQVKRGVSGDGQLIINTGLLPTQSSVACMAYGTNTYPNIAQYFKSSCTINPCPNVWNQPVVNSRYGYKKLVENDSVAGDSAWLNDAKIFTLAAQALDSCESPVCMQILTFSTHIPFEIQTTDNLVFQNDIPEELAKYLHALHYTDSCLNIFLTKLLNNQQFANSNIVITGDHTIFKPYKWQSYTGFVEKYKLPIPTEESFCPLLIASDQKSRIFIQDTCYQMDIFPTLLHITYLQDSYWNGFGINLFNGGERTISEDSAYYISNKLIMANYFDKIPVSQEQ
ncbi:MAG: sulfatase-like hydrolase/transferase [Bacteroidales bacterium]|nr:sulfatase-like hydrolase/transferase [Bacteroidales bacterium]